MVSLQELNSGTFAEKFYLNPVCGTITCNNIFANNLPASFNQALNTFNAVQFAGITSTSTIDAGANFVLSSAVPTLNTHLTNKLYVDTGLNGKLSLSGGTMTGNITTLRTNDTNIVLGSGTVVPTSASGTVQIGTNAGDASILNGAICIGDSAANVGAANFSITIGRFAGASSAPKLNAISIGNSANGRSGGGVNSIAIGETCCDTVNTINDRSIAIGQGSGNLGMGLEAIAIGKSASSVGIFSTALGPSATSAGDSGISVGASAVASALNSIAIGQASNAVNTNSMVFNANGFTIGQSTANNQISFIAGTTNFTYDATGFNITNATSSTSTTTGSLRCAGGLGVVQNLNVGGTFTCPMPIGGLFMESNATTTTVSATPGNFVKILGTTTASTQNVSFTHANNRLTYTGTKTTIFAVSYCMNLNPSTSTDIEWEVGVSLDGSATPQLMGRTHVHSITNGHRYSCSGVLIITLATSQFVELFLANKTNNTTNCIVEDMSIVMNPFTN